jgi:hypothetical protein
MGTTTRTTSSQQQSQTSNRRNVFDPTSMGVYQQLQPQIQQGLTNPFQSDFYNQLFSMFHRGASEAARGANQTQMTGLLGSMRGLAENDPARIANMARAGRAGSRNLANAFFGSQGQAYGGTQENLRLMMGYSPLLLGEDASAQGTMTGEQTQRQSGLGTWLTPLLGAAIGGFTGGLGGGVGSRLFGGGASAAGSGAVSGFMPSTGSLGNVFGGGAGSLGAGNPEGWGSNPFINPRFAGRNQSPFAPTSRNFYVPGRGF